MLKRAKSSAVNLLRWSEPYTKIDMVYFASGSFWQTFGQVTSGVLSFALVIIFANFLPKEIYGLYRYVLSLAAILNIFTLTGMNQAVVQAVATGDEGALRTSVKYQLKWNSILMLAFWICGAYYFFHANWTLATSLLILSLFLPLTAALNTYGAYLSGKREFRLNNLFSIISTLIYVAGMSLAIFLNGQLIWLVVAYSLTTFISTLIFYVATLRMFKPPTESPNDVLKYGRNLTFIGLISPVASQLDSIILNHFWGPVSLAVYSLAMAVPNRAVSFIKDWVDIGFPKVASKTPREINTVFYRRIAQGLFTGALFGGCYIVLAPYVFKYLMPQYLDSVFFSQLLAISFVFAMPNRYISLLFAAHKLSRLIFINTIIQSTIRIALYLILGIWGGILGLVIAQVISSGVSLLINAAMWRSGRFR